MTSIQIVLIAFAAFAISRVVLRFRRGGMPLWQLAAWTFFWAMAIVVVLRPETASALARVLGVGRGADVIVYLAVVAAFYLIFRLFAKLEDVERQITRLVRDEALRDLDRDADAK